MDLVFIISLVPDATYAHIPGGMWAALYLLRLTTSEFRGVPGALQIPHEGTGEGLHRGKELQLDIYGKERPEFRLDEKVLLRSDVTRAEDSSLFHGFSTPLSHSLPSMDDVKAPGRPPDTIEDFDVRFGKVDPGLVSRAVVGVFRLNRLNPAPLALPLPALNDVSTLPGEIDSVAGHKLIIVVRHSG